jgi:hypothetical protein
MRAAHRRIFGDGDRRFRRTDHDVGQRNRLGHGGGDRTLRHRRISRNQGGEGKKHGNGDTAANGQLMALGKIRGKGCFHHSLPGWLSVFSAQRQSGSRYRKSAFDRSGQRFA